MNYRVWYSTESFADFIIAHTELRHKSVTKKKLYESDANNPRNFHAMPDHIKKILYLDSPDLIVEIDHEPIFSVEVSTEAGTGHNAFQRFARLAASVENNVPAFYIYPEAVIIQRQNTPPNWDRINPLVFMALEKVMAIYQMPALLYYYPSDFRTHPAANTSPNHATKGLLRDPNFAYGGSPLAADVDMQDMFAAMNEVMAVFEHHGIVVGRAHLLAAPKVMERRAYMEAEYTRKGGALTMSPLSATIKVPTDYLLRYLSQYEEASYEVGELLRSRAETIIYQVNAGFRGDPYPGALAAIDYLMCRQGRSFEEREYNLVLAWSNVDVDDAAGTIALPGTKGDINDFFEAVQSSENKNILAKTHADVPSHEIPRYYMQVRYGSTYSKVKHIRVFSYFADAILFPNGALWRDG